MLSRFFLDLLRLSLLFYLKFLGVSDTIKGSRCESCTGISMPASSTYCPEGLLESLEKLSVSARPSWLSVLLSLLICDTLIYDALIGAFVPVDDRGIMALLSSLFAFVPVDCGAAYA